MLLGSKLTPYVKYNNLGTKNFNSGQQLGNKSPFTIAPRRVLPMPTHTIAMHNSPIEKYHVNNH